MNTIKLAPSSSCTGCLSCANVCPNSSIKCVYNKYGFLEPFIDNNTCLGCRKCEKNCPIINLGNKKNISLPIVFSAALKDDDIRKISTSGGMFYVLSRRVLSKGGIVFGARFDGVHVKHDYTDNINGLYPFMGSKYVQSDIGDSFCRVKQFLLEGRPVLFSGTPCQIAGLRHFLHKEYDNLLTVSLLCKGVPSPKVWEKYISKKLKELGAKKIKDIRFRTKKQDYKSPVITYVLKFLWEDSSGEWNVYWENCRENSYFSYFLNHIFRSSCFECKFRNYYEAETDITLGDAIENSLNLDKGVNDVSTIVLHTSKAKHLWTYVMDELYFNKIDIEILNKMYDSAAKLLIKDKRTRMWRLSNRLALLIPLKYFRFIYERKISGFVISIINKIFKTSF